MKNNILLVILLISFAGLGQNTLNDEQQDLLDNQPKISISVRAGWLQSTLKGQDVDYLNSNKKIDSYNGYMVGFTLDNPIGKHISLKHEIFYQTYGAKFERSMNDTSFDSKLEMHSIWLNLASPTFTYKGFQIYAGPFLNMMTYSSITAMDENGNIYKDHQIFGHAEDDQEDGYFLQKTDFGIVAGAEYQFPFGGLIGARYTRGVFRLFDNSNAADLENNPGRKDLCIYNQNFGIYLGYRF